MRGRRRFTPVATDFAPFLGFYRALTKRYLMAIFSRFGFKRPADDRPLIEREIVELTKALFDAIARRVTDYILGMSASDGVAAIFKEASIRATRLSEFLEELGDEPCHYRLLVPDIKLLIHLTQAMALVPYEAIFDNGYAYFGSISFVFIKRSGKWVVFSAAQIRSMTITSYSEAFSSALMCIS